MENSHVFPEFIRRFVAAADVGKEAEVLWGTGKPLLEFMHVDDVADAVYYFMQNHDDLNAVNIGYRTDVTIAELVERLLLRRDSMAGLKGTQRSPTACTGSS